MAYEKIKEAIITEKYKTDQFLSSRELCADLGISRTPVMEALRRLAYEGFVEAVPDKGMFVSGHAWRLYWTVWDRWVWRVLRCLRGQENWWR